jgi:hypothetical protein
VRSHWVESGVRCGAAASSFPLSFTTSASLWVASCFLLKLGALFPSPLKAEKMHVDAAYVASESSTCSLTMEADRRLASLGTTLNRAISVRVQDLASLAEELDWALQTLTLHRCRITALGNTIPPISSLPSEVLALIFSFANQRTEPSISRETPIRLSFAQVCRTWRAVALDTPSLWVRPLFRWPAFAQLMLSHARELPIVVECDLSEATKTKRRLISNGLEAACGRMAAVRRMELSGPADVLCEVLLTADSREASQLEMFNIDFSLPDNLSMPHTLRGSLTRFLLGKPPGYHFLQTHYVDDSGPMGDIMSWAPCAHLTELVLKGRTFVDISLGPLVAILKRTRRLQKLVLEGVYSDQHMFDAPNSFTDVPVALRDLRFIRLEEYISGSALLLERLALPPDVIIHLDDGNDESEGPEIEQALTVLATHVFPTDGWSLVSLRVEVEDISFSVQGTDESTKTRFVLRAHDSDTEFNEIFRNIIVRALPVEGCESLTLAIDHRSDVVGPDGEDWLSAFTRLHNIESVYLHDLAAVGFIEGLRLLRVRTQSPKLSALRKLEFYHVNLDMMIETEVRDDVGEWVASQALAIDILADAPQGSCRSGRDVVRPGLRQVLRNDETRDGRRPQVAWHHASPDGA